MAKRRGRGEGSISKRKDGRWEARIDLGWETGKRLRKAFYGKTGAEVAAKLTEALAARRRGVPMADEREQLGPWLDRWLVEIAEPPIGTPRLAQNRENLPKVFPLWITARARD